MRENADSKKNALQNSKIVILNDELIIIPILVSLLPGRKIYIYM